MSVEVKDLDLKNVMWVKRNRNDIKICMPKVDGEFPFEIPNNKPSVVYTFEECAWHHEDSRVYLLNAITPYIENLVIYHFVEYKGIVFGDRLSKLDKIVSIDTELLKVNDPIYSIGTDPENPGGDVYDISVGLTDIVDVTEVTKRFAVGATGNIHWNGHTRNGQITSVQISNGELIIQFKKIHKGDYLNLDIREFLRKVYK